MKKISGKYKHYKGNDYEVFCEAEDNNGVKYVLYQQLYGNKAFWIRPYDMFFEEISITNEDGVERKLPRFKPPRKQSFPNEYIDRLISYVKNETITLKHSESEKEYIITSISKVDGKVVVQPYSLFANEYEGYLTEYELIRRLGKNCCLIDNKLEVWDSKSPLHPQSRLVIDGYDNKIISDMINPCSIDLKIANFGFLRTRHKKVDPESIEHASKASDLWKKVRMYKSKAKDSKYFKLRPRQTVLTHIENRITLPADCAGKIEIKSSYARLSLSITSGDFCNPGYDGFFPLEITNNGNHTILMHTGAVMGQLMLIPMCGPVLVKYSEKATQKNQKGFDDGTPYSFWLERSIKRIRKEFGDESLIDVYKRIRQEIKSSTVDDINSTKDRFDDSFLTFCQNRIYKSKYKSKDRNYPNVAKLVTDYINREKAIKKLYNIRWASGAIAICGFVFSAITFFYNWNKSINIPYSNWYWIIALLLTVVFVFFQVKKPKAFCTFEKMDIESILEKISQE